jgi:uncharacterized protein YjbI with pentapeptide repeats
VKIFDFYFAQINPNCCISMHTLSIVALLLLLSKLEGWTLKFPPLALQPRKFASNGIQSALIASSIFLSQAAFADGGATTGANAKITTGGASTLQSGRTIAITRGVNLDRQDFSNQNLKGVAFQQSIVRDASFKNR